MDIFLSYSSKQRDVAHRLSLSLEGQGHNVFFDRTDLREGGEFDARIRKAIEGSDLFIFLISPDSIAQGSYPMAELGMAEGLWPHPEGRVLPVLVMPVKIDEVPPYARAISILKPRGDFVAEVSAAVARMSGKRRRVGIWVAATVVIVALAAFGWMAYQRSREDEARQAEVSRVEAAARLDLEAGQYEAAFQSLASAVERWPDQPQLRRAHEEGAMLWSRNIRVVQGERTFADIVSLVRPVLSAGAASAEGPYAADLHAHVGWCEYLLDRETVSGNPETYFKRAAELDESNPYAHSMWGFWLFMKGGSVAATAPHFDQAASTGRDRSWVRNLQISAMLNRPTPEHEMEALRVANIMRKEAVAVESPHRLWNIIQADLLYGRDNTIKALPPKELLETFRWLFPDESSVDDYRATLYHFILARLEEAAGNRDAALSGYRRVEAEVKDSPGSLQDRTKAGLQRTSSSR
jgi:hypothetical protein